MPIPRPQVTEEIIDEVLNEARHHLNMRLHQKGRGAFVLTHEILGQVTEEYKEYVDAVQSNREDRVRAELWDIMIATIHAQVSYKMAAVE